MLSMSAFSQPPCCSICFSTKLNRWLNLVLHPRKAVSGSISKWRARFTKVNNRSPSSSCWRSLLFEIANSAFNSSSSSFTLSNTPSILGQSNPTLLAFFCSFTARVKAGRSEEHTSELQSRPHLVCRLLLEKKKRLSRQPAAPPVRDSGGDRVRDRVACYDRVQVPRVRVASRVRAPDPLDPVRQAARGLVLA